MRITVTVDGTSYTDDVEPRLLLVHYLRERLGKVGTVVGCDTSNCGACTVHLERGRPCRGERASPSGPRAATGRGPTDARRRVALVPGEELVASVAGERDGECCRVIFAR